MVGIINYKAGNSKSVKNSLDLLGIKSKYISKQCDFKQVSSIILPGVGSAKATMESLKELQVLETLSNSVLNYKIPFLGICVGLQVLFDYSEEGETKCLGWLEGKVRKFDQTSVRIPQIGWNKVSYSKSDIIIKGKPHSEYYYFVNSYYVVPKETDIELGKTEYGEQFVSMISKDNIYGVQCHIEKSGKVGLQLLENFVKRERYYVD